MNIADDLSSRLNVLNVKGFKNQKKVLGNKKFLDLDSTLTNCSKD